MADAVPGVTPAIRIRDATPADLDAVEVLESRIFDSDQLSRRSLRYYIGSPTARFLVMEQSGTIIGDAIVAFRRNARVARLYSIAIHPDYAGEGHGSRLLAASEAAAREHGAKALRLEVRADNAPAIALYRKSGYAEFGRHGGYYEDGMDALRFEKPLPRSGREA